MIVADSNPFLGFLILAILLGLYFLPTIVALNRDVLNKWSVLVINLLLGWTLIGWAVALAMAVRTQREPRHST
jgi:hypothetical protein